MRRIFLDEIGDVSRWDNRYAEPRHCNFLNHRSWYPTRQLLRRGVADAATWNFDSAALEYVYEGLRAYLLDDNAGGTIDFVADAEYKFIVCDGIKYTPLDAIQEIIYLAEYILGDPRQIKVYGRRKKAKRAAALARLQANPYYKENGCWFNDWCLADAAPIEEDREHMLTRKFWGIWAVIFPYMWW